MFPLKIMVRYVRRVSQPGIRSVSSSTALVGVVVDSDGIATVTMRRPPVNSLNLHLLQDLNKALDDVTRIKCKAAVLTSASSTVFSAGLDLYELYQPQRQRLETFLTTLQEVWIKLYGSNFITAAAINGHSPAGGCLLAMGCDYRVMVSGRYFIGMNEMAIGIIVPKWIIESMANILPQRATELAFTSAKMFTVDEALKVGLIDETATDKADAIEKCREFIRRFDRIPRLARAVTKQNTKEASLMRIKTHDVQEFIEFIITPNFQEILEVYIRKLKQKAC